MWTRRLLSKAGVRVYGLGAMALGLVGLVWGDFADAWQPIQAFGNVPHRELLAYCAAVLELAAGAAIQWRRTARAGVLVSGTLFFIFACFWLPRVIGFPQIFGTWGGFLEAFSLVAGAVVLYASLASAESMNVVRAAYLGRVLYGICVLGFAMDHFLYIQQTADMVPKWIPPGQHFWAVATGIFHLLAGLAILTGVLDSLGSRLLTLMLIVFGALVWLPRLVTAPHAHMSWAGNAIHLALTGAAWVIADAIASRDCGPVTKESMLPSEFFSVEAMRHRRAIRRDGPSEPEFEVPAV
ncbi:MAG TPA: DoxX family membrane protein [Bryobacteraceae bacterium]|nr:DoxX family membrane protein [Bryobacteraceae bacterium]